MGRLALLSVSDKTGIVALAQRLVEEFEFELIGSGGTAKVLREAGLSITEVADYTDSPEILGGRVKTLHPRIHGGILGRRDLPSNCAEMAANQIRPLDLVVVNLYPFEETIAKPGISMSEAIEKIDVGGPTMLRAAAKNFAHLTVLCNPERYGEYAEELSKYNGETSLEFRQARAKEGFLHTAAYDHAIANYFLGLDEESGTSLPENYSLVGKQLQSLRYGENPHQPASWYQTGNVATGWSAAQKLQGKELSYNNLVDLEAARRIIAEFPATEPTALVLKHTNPCGVAMGETLADAYTKAFEADSMSAFGGIVALNQEIDAATARSLKQTFLECVVAPSCDAEAKEILGKKSKLRVMLLPDLGKGSKESIKVIAGGFLVQTADDLVEDPQNWQVVTQKQPTPAQLAELLFAWKVCKYVKSNAIVVSRNRTTLGIGAGQMNRVGAAKIALEQAGERSKGATLASDGFFPFDDSVKTAAAAGITAIVQPGGSLRDQDSIAAANELRMVMVLTGIRHFLH
ncbi:MAG: bifunctional phosphoribosylaminoimidazolecarboxamide formyltransferase/IMP cyclohydrolase [Spirulinaceae cyanobacterium]